MLTSPELDTNVPVLLFKADPCVIHHGAVGVARRLGRARVPVYATVEDHITPLAMCRYVTGTFVNRAEDANGLLNYLAAIGASINRPTILLATDDGAAVFVAEHEKALRRWFLFPHLPTGLARELADKSSLYSLCGRLGVPCPEIVLPTSVEQLHQFVVRASFPVVVKAAQHSLRLSNHCTSFIVKTPRELCSLYEGEENFLHPNMILQEYVPGEDWIFHGYTNQETECFAGFTGRKIRSYPASAGPTTLGVSVPNNSLCRQAETMLRALGYSGIADLDYRRDERDGRYKLLDFNPRVGANFRMFEDSGGIDVVRALHLDLTGKRVRNSPMIEGRTFIVEPHDVFASFVHLRRGELTLKAWRKSLSGARELAWWSPDDPLPFFAMSLRLAHRVIRRAMQAGWRQARTSWRRLGRNRKSSTFAQWPSFSEDNLGVAKRPAPSDREAFPGSL